jgi:hypothetical protein
MDEKEFGWQALLLAGDKTVDEDLRAAETLYRRALSVAETTFGSRHANVALTLMCLADCLDAQGNELQAKPLYRRVRQILAFQLRTEQSQPDAG